MEKLLYPIFILIYTPILLSSISEAPSPLISEQEKRDLLYLREEEKLARDVYLYAYDLYGMRIFSNISESEQVHCDRVLELLVEFGLSDIAKQELGSFSNPALQALYNDLVSRCDKSLLDALKVGATIEDLDIFDIEEMIGHTNNPTILSVYENLKCGSENHMRAFNRQLQRRGFYYTPEHISKNFFEKIISKSNACCGCD